MLHSTINYRILREYVITLIICSIVTRIWIFSFTWKVLCKHYYLNTFYIIICWHLLVTTQNKYQYLFHLPIIFYEIVNQAVPCSNYKDMQWNIVNKYFFFFRDSLKLIKQLVRKNAMLLACKWMDMKIPLINTLKLRQLKFLPTQRTR